MIKCEIKETDRQLALRQALEDKEARDNLCGFFDLLYKWQQELENKRNLKDIENAES